MNLADPQMLIDIDVEQVKVFRDRKLVATMHLLESCEIQSVALDKTSSSKLFMTPESTRFHSESGNTLQRKRLFKADWNPKYKGFQPLPFEEASFDFRFAFKGKV